MIALATAFAGAMLVAYSQMRPEDISGKGIAQIFGQGSWYFAIPISLFTLAQRHANRPLVQGLSRARFDRPPRCRPRRSCSFPSALSIYGFNHTDFRSIGARRDCWPPEQSPRRESGRLLYQLALSKTDGDNGFVTMFSLLGPGLAAVYSWLLSYWIAGLRFQANATYLIGLAVTAGALFYFLRRSRAR